MHLCPFCRGLTASVFYGAETALYATLTLEVPMADIYILLGPEEGEKNNLIRKIKSTVLENWPDTECYSFFVGDDDESSYIAAVSQPSLFASHRFITIRGLDELKKTDEVYLQTIEAVKDNQPDLTLIITSTDTQTSKFDKVILDAAGKERTRIFWELKEADKINWIYRKVREEHFDITRDAVSEILSTVENNTEEMKNLVLSITNFLRIKGEKSTIEREDIEAYSTASKGENGYTLFKALGEKDLDRALRIVDSILLNDSRNILPAFTVAGNQFRRLEAALKMKKNGAMEKTIFETLTAFTTYPGKGRSGVNFKEAELFRTAMRNYTIEDTKRIILLLGRADTTLKTSAYDTLLTNSELLVYTIISCGGKETELSLEPENLMADPYTKN